MKVDKLTPVERQKIKELAEDPVKWAKVFVRTYDPIKRKVTPWIARWYQEKILRDKSRKKVARCGRRTGKCLPGWVKVLDPVTGDLRTVSDIYSAGCAHIATMTDDLKLKQSFSPLVLDNGVKEVFRVILKSGRVIDATGNHPLYTIDGWKTIDQLSLKENVAVPRELPFFGNQDMPVEHVKFLGYMIGGSFRFSNNNKKIIQELKECLENFQCELVHHPYSSSCDYHIRRKYKNSGQNKVRKFLRDLEINFQNSHNKTIPDEVFRLKKDLVALFLSRLFSTDGWCSSSEENKPRVEVGYATVSEELAHGVQHLLLRFGVRCSLSEKKIKYNGTIRKVYYVFTCSRADVKKFIKEIGIFGKEEATQKALKIIEKYGSGNDDFLPEKLSLEADKLRAEKGITYAGLLGAIRDPRFGPQYALQRKTLVKCSEALDDERLKNLAESDIFWDEVVSIESIGCHQTYDLSVPGTHNFVANDIIVHNTDVLCIDSLHKSFVNRNFRVIIIAPYENQIRIVFSRLRELIDMSPLLKGEVDRSNNNPFQLIRKNKSATLGFTTGASSGSGGASIRGQRADAIYMDETDYMSDADFDTVMTIAAERPDISIWMSSTPTGRRSRFYFACVDKKLGFSEHYYPSSVLPLWSDEMETEWRAQLTEQGYIHEIEAEFGTQETGVFSKDKLDIAMKQEFYAYNELTYIQKDKMEREGWTPNFYIYDNGKKAPINPFRTVGVDFDKYSASSSIVVLDYDVFRGKFKVLKRIEVPRSEYSYDTAINWIVEVNDIYNPAWIYCDKGQSEYQIERLHIIGEERPSTGLKNKVKGWQFAENLDIMDPITKEMDKKELKSFMVNQLQIAFEREKLMLSPFDDILHKQLVDYEVVRITQAGKPVYTDKNEHFVDALGLAYLAFVLEFPELTNTIKQIKSSIKISYSDKRLGEERLRNMINQSEFRYGGSRPNPEDLPGDRPQWFKLGGFGQHSKGSSGWGSRMSRGVSRTIW